MRGSTWFAVAAGLWGCGGGTAPQNSTLGQLPTETCNGAASSCLYGTARATGFSVSVSSFQVSLYNVFPSGPAAGNGWPKQHTVAKDGTWAFSGLDPWGHYYVQIVPAFITNPTLTAGARVGPLAIPSTPGPVDVQVKPVQLDVLEEASPGVPSQLRRATAHVFDPASGNEVVQGGATASILVGSTPTPMPWKMFSNLSAYLVEFTPPPSPPPAQAAYTMTTSLAAPTSATWTLASDPPTFMPTITAPPAGMSFPKGQDILVTWPLQPGADYETVQLYVSQNGGLAQTYASPTPDATDVNEERIPGMNLATPGSYLVVVAFVKSNCPASKDGCVHSSTLATQSITVK
jgi:hypothetical protein